MRLSAVVAAYNEEKSIGGMLRSVLNQRLVHGELSEIVVVASGCTDLTVRRVEEVAREDRRVRVLVQDARLGKASALNAYFRERDPLADVIVMASADVLLQPGCLQLMVECFESDPQIGMCGARPIPTNSRDHLIGRMVGFLWDLHHDVALEAPKLGEVCAMRARLVTSISENTPVDEASLEAVVVQKGYKLAYVPEAVAANRGPSSMSEFISQRRRIAAGHYWLRAETGYSVATLDTRRIIKLAARRLTLSDPRTDASYVVAAAVEALSRGLGYIDYRRKHSHAIWEIAPSTKDVVAPEPPRSEADSTEERASEPHREVMNG
jgi:glycosyltransferase involved in cell wall biosynthesis